MKYVKRKKLWFLGLILSLTCALYFTVKSYKLNQSLKETAQRVYAMPERSGIPTPTNDGGPPYVPATTVEDAPEVAISDAPANADSPEDLEPLEECCDEEVVSEALAETTLSKEEVEKRLKVIKEFYDELGRNFEKIDTDRETLFARADKLVDRYVEYSHAIVDLLSPKYQQRFDEIESLEDLTPEEVDGINMELEVIENELGIDIDDFAHQVAEEYRQKLQSIFDSIDQLDVRESDLMQEMEEFSNDG